VSSTPCAAGLTYDSIVTRSVEKRGSRVFELFRMTVLKDADDLPPAADEPAELRVGSYLARHLPKLGPGVVYRRTLDDAADPFDSVKYLGENLAPPQTFEQQALKEVELDEVTPMPEDTFWRVIGRAAQGATRATVAALSKDLETMGLGATLAFARALELHLGLLVRPELLDVGLRMPGRVRLSADAALYLGCAIVLDGKHRYQRSREDPGVAWNPGESFDAEELLSAAPDSYEAITGHEVVFTSAISREMDHRLEPEGAGRNVLQPDTQQNSEAAKQAAWEENARFIAGLLGMKVEGEVWLRYENRARWMTARFVFHISSRFEELLLMFPMRDVDGRSRGLNSARELALGYGQDWAHAEGGIVMPGLETEETGLPYPRDGDLIFWIERKYPHSMSEYLSEFGLL